MTVGTFKQPNFVTDTDASVYKGKLDENAAVFNRIAGQFAPHESATPNMTVTVDAGRLMYNGGLIVYGQQVSGVITAPVTYPRMDHVVIDEQTGVISVITGTESATPAPPPIPAGKLPCCFVTLQTSTTAITNSMLVDVRALYKSKAIRGALVYASSSQSIATGVQTILTFWDSEQYDTDNIHDISTNPDRLTVPSGVTKVRVGAYISWQNNATGMRRIEIVKNAFAGYVGFAGDRRLTDGSASDAIIWTPKIDVVGGDYFRLNCAQGSGVALNVLGAAYGISWFAMEIIE